VVIDNAIEGCIGETYAALQATFQATQSKNPIVRSVLRGIAADETEHAAFSWKLHGWACRPLDGATRRRIHAAQRRAIHRLREGVGEPPHEARHTLGLPSAQHQRQLLDCLERALLG
jgi:hypothetical protein